jgi:hypothetical protein
MAPHGMLGGRIHRVAGPDLVARHGGDVDDVAGLLPLHVRQRRGDTIQHALDVHVDGAVPVVHRKALERRERHEPSVVEQHVDASIRLHGRVYQSLDLLAVCDVRGSGQRLAAFGGQVPSQRLDALDAPGSEYDGCPLGAQVPSGRFAQPAARAGDDDDLAFNVVAHGSHPMAPVLATSAFARFTADIAFGHPT